MIAFIRFMLVIFLVGGSVYGGLTLFWPRQPVVVPVQAAAHPTRTPRPSRTPTSGPLLNLAPLLDPTATAEPTATTTSTPEPTETPSATPVRPAQIVSAISEASFRAGDGGMRHNITIALDANGGALRRVVIAPGQIFSFNDSLGPNANRLRWKSVGRIVPGSQQVLPDVRFVSTNQVTGTLDFGEFGRATAMPAAPSEAAPAGAPPVAQPALPPAVPAATNEPTPTRIYVVGGGVCDLASRYVMAGRRLLPNRAFNFKRHTGGIAGVRIQDAVSIWTTDNGRYDNDLLITNTTQSWLVFEATVEGQSVTIRAWLQDAP